MDDTCSWLFRSCCRSCCGVVSGSPNNSRHHLPDNTRANILVSTPGCSCMAFPFLEAGHLCGPKVINSKPVSRSPKPSRNLPTYPKPGSKCCGPFQKTAFLSSFKGSNQVADLLYRASQRLAKNIAEQTLV